MSKKIYIGSTEIAGSDGKSAYQSWLDQGNTGTEAQFLASLQGNSGYSGAAGELEVVNNLTDGGATAALSAQQGVVLKGQIDQLGLNLTEKLYPWESGAINYLNGNDAVNTKAVRTGHIPIYENTDFILSFPKDGHDTYIVKYLGGTYVGYQAVVATYDTKKISVVADSTFDTIRFRVSADTDWTDNEIAACICKAIILGSIGETVAELEDEVTDLIGEAIEFEIGGLNYLTGMRITDAKTIRTKEYVSINFDTILRISSVASFSGWLIKYNDFAYVGYETFSINENGTIDLSLIKDSTFNSVKIRLSRTANITQAQLEGVNAKKLGPNDYTDVKVGEVDAKLYITPALHAGYYLHKDDGKLRKTDGWYYTDFVEVDKLGKFDYSFWGGPSASICGYDADMNFVEALVYGAGLNEGTYTITNPNIKYVRGCTNNTIFYVIKVQRPYVAAQGYTIGCQAISLQSEDKRALGFLTMESRQFEGSWIKLSENYSLPSDGVYLGRIGNDLYLSVNGTLTKLN